MPRPNEAMQGVELWRVNPTTNQFEPVDPTVDAPAGSKVFTWNPDGTLASITGTGSYRSKTFTWNPDGTLASITVT